MLHHASREYAIVLHRFASKNQSLPSVLEEATMLINTLKGKRNSTLLLSRMRNDEFLEVVNSMKLSSSMQKFLVMVHKNSCTAILMQILNYLLYYDDSKNNQEHVKITSKVSIGKDISDTLLSKLERRTGKKIIAETETDPSMLGGFIVKGRSFIVDLTLQTQLRILGLHVRGSV